MHGDCRKCTHKDSDIGYFCCHCKHYEGLEDYWEQEETLEEGK